MATLILNERPPTGLLVAQVVGITASAYLFGQNTSLSLITVPTIMKAPAGLAVRQWRSMFDKGQMMGPPLAVLGALGVGYVAWCQDPSSTAFKLNLTASILFPSIVPFTFAFIKPTNDKLFAKEKLLASNAAALAAEDDQKEVGTEGGENTHALIDRWGVLNLARALVTGVGVVCAVCGAVEGSGLDLI